MDFDYELIRQKRKTVSIQIEDGKVVVKAPMRYPEREIKEFVNKKQRWIKKHLDLNLNKPKLSSIEGEYCSYLGDNYKVKIIEKSIQEKVEIYDDELVIFTHGKRDNLKHNEKIFMKWIISQANKILTERYRENFELFDYRKMPDLYIRDFKRRWGAYHKHGFHEDYIKLNWRLIMYPMQSIDYVIIHEFAHKTHHNHSKDFYNLVEEKYPEWKKWKNLLDGKVD